MSCFAFFALFFGVFRVLFGVVRVVFRVFRVVLCFRVVFVFFVSFFVFPLSFFAFFLFFLFFFLFLFFLRFCVFAFFVLGFFFCVFSVLPFLLSSPLVSPLPPSFVFRFFSHGKCRIPLPGKLCPLARRSAPDAAAHSEWGYNIALPLRNRLFCPRPPGRGVHSTNRCLRGAGPSQHFGYAWNPPRTSKYSPNAPSKIRVMGVRIAYAPGCGQRR